MIYNTSGCYPTEFISRTDDKTDGNLGKSVVITEYNITVSGKYNFRSSYRRVYDFDVMQKVITMGATWSFLFNRLV